MNKTMDNILYKYPQSSCNCYQCDKETYPSNQGSVTNFSVRGCRVPKGFECYDREIFQQNVEPYKTEIGSNECQEHEDSVSNRPGANRQGYTFLNKSGLQLSEGFYSIDCTSPDSACPGTTYVSHDPRLLDPVRNSLLHLDRPPMTGDLALKNVYSPDLKNYGKGYHTYLNISGGHIQYYIDDSIKDAIYEPVYDIPAEVTGLVYQDPMSNMKPQYLRKPGNTGQKMGVSQLPTPGDTYGCLSFIDDTSNHREDLISRQQLKNNQQKWSARWGNQ